MYAAYVLYRSLDLECRECSGREYPLLAVMVVPLFQIGLHVLTAVTCEIYVNIKNSLRKGAVGPLPISSIYKAVNNSDLL